MFVTFIFSGSTLFCTVYINIYKVLYVYILYIWYTYIHTCIHTYIHIHIWYIYIHILYIYIWYIYILYIYILYIYILYIYIWYIYIWYIYIYIYLYQYIYIHKQIHCWRTLDFLGGAGSPLLAAPEFLQGLEDAARQLTALGQITGKTCGLKSMTHISSYIPFGNQRWHRKIHKWKFLSENHP